MKAPTEAEYNKATIRLALSWCDIRACKKCGWPVMSGYCCNTCGSNSPDTTAQQDKEFDKLQSGGVKMS